jgi:hypothetical protein
MKGWVLRGAKGYAVVLVISFAIASASAIALKMLGDVVVVEGDKGHISFRLERAPAN